MNFPTTHWSLLAQATLNGDAAGREALSALCRVYWRPVADFLRHKGWKDADAEDQTQEFFSALLASRGWQRADRARGRFRNFLLGALMRVMLNGRERDRAQKRGGGQLVASLDEMADDGFESGAMDDEASRIFDQSWAAEVLETALQAVAADWEKAGQGAVFRILLTYLPAGLPPVSYEEAALQLGQSLGAVKSRILRLRQEFRARLEQIIARTVSAPHEIAEEMAFLARVLADPGFSPRGQRDETPADFFGE